VTIVPRRQPVTAVKLLKKIDLPASASHQHEINGPGTFRRVLGFERVAGRMRWLYFKEDEPVETEGDFTWYDARARSAERTGRSEWRLYYDRAFPADAAEGDLLLVMRGSRGNPVGAVLAAGSKWVRAAQLLEQPGGLSAGSSAEALFEALEGKGPD
jgi:hypothetical protein